MPKMSFKEFCKNYCTFSEGNFFPDENRFSTHGYEVQRCGSWLFFSPVGLVREFKTRKQACAYANRYMYQDYLKSPNW